SPDTGPDVTTDAAGALPAADDDGSVEFETSAGGLGQIIHVDDPVTRRFNWGGTPRALTVTAWIKPKASASTFTGIAVGQTGHQIPILAPLEFGWEVGAAWPTRTPHF